MYLSSRKKKILDAVIKTYSVTGEPVGSKALLENLDISVSSATIRNEMAELANMGYLIQPHTSAGRIPSKKGYRLYLNSLSALPVVPKQNQDLIEDTLSSCADEPGHILECAANILSQMTGLVSTATSPPGDKSCIQKVKFVQTGRNTAMLIIITSMGMVQSRLFRVEYALSDEILKVFERALNEKLARVPLLEITPAFIQSLCAGLGELAILMPNIMIALVNSAKEVLGTNVILSGQFNLLLCHDFDITTVRNVSSFIYNKDRLSSLLIGAQNQTGVFLGDESGQPELSSSSVIFSKYQIDEHMGAIALFGPLRLDYPKHISLVVYTAEVVSKLINGLLEP